MRKFERLQYMLSMVIILEALTAMLLDLDDDYGIDDST